MANTLSSAPSDISRRVLIREGLGVDPPNSPWPIFTDAQPNTPDNVITVMDTSGVSDGRSQIDGELFTHYGIMVMIRGKDSPTGFLKADQIRRSMAQIIYDEVIVINNIPYALHCFSKISAVLPLGKEQDPPTKRNLFTINALVVVKQL